MLGQTLSHYRITARIGAGGMGEVYRARDEHLHRDVAVKVLPSGLLEDEAARRRFRKEALTLSRLNHPNIATVYDFDRQDGVDFLVMEFVEGQDLAALIRSAGGGRESAPGTDATARTAEAPPPEGLDEATCIRLADQIAAALEEAHEHGIVHRDLKPHNVMVTPKGQVKVLDFGLAKLVRDPGPEAATETLTQMGMVAGTLPYMAPEQVQGHPADARTDVYAWGVTLYELLTGRRPYPQTDATTLVAAIVQGEPPSLSRVRPGMSPWLEAVVLRALAREPERRYASAAELRAELAARTATIPGAGRRRRGLVVGALAVLAVALGTWLYTGREGAGGDARTSLAVLYFENLADPSDSLSQGPSLTNLLITDLSESRYLDVLSGQRLRDLVKLQGKEGEHVLDGETSTAVAQQAGMGTMLVGSILQSVPQLLITSQLVDVESGATRASQRVLADPGEDLFAVVDRLAAEVKRDLELPEEAAQELDRPVSAVTTESEEAYRHYLEGVELHEKFFPNRAKAAFARATQADSTFAMADYRSAMTYWTVPEAAASRIATAHRHANRASLRERKLIESMYEYYLGDPEVARDRLRSMIELHPSDKDLHWALVVALGNPDRQWYLYEGERLPEKIEILRRILELDPMDRMAFNELCYVYEKTGDWVNAIVTARNYVEAFPEEYNAYDVLGDMYRKDARLEEAIEAYRRGLECDPPMWFTAQKLVHLLAIAGMHEEAIEWLERVADSGTDFSKHVPYQLGQIMAHQGRFQAALDAFGEEEDLQWARLIVLMRLERWPEARFIWDRMGLDEYPSITARFLAHQGKLEEAEARFEEVGREPPEATKFNPKVFQVFRWQARCWIDVLKGDAQAAATAADSLGRYHGPEAGSEILVRAQAYRRVGRTAEAIHLLEDLRELSIRLGHMGYGMLLDFALAEYELALAYEESGWREKAAEQYERFLHLWRNADPGAPEVTNARRRLLALR